MIEFLYNGGILYFCVNQVSFVAEGKACSLELLGSLQVIPVMGLSSRQNANDIIALSYT
jgi:hypothetical protein